MDPARRYLDMAARLAWRGAGNIEPNPPVGAVIVKNDRVIGMGHHRVYGGAHAEVEALTECARRGLSPSGGTMYVTLEPCNHTGRTPPCTRALIGSGITRVVIARADPNPIAAGGAETLRAAGVTVEFSDASVIARGISDPFVRRTTTDLPWVIAKWAQTADGRLITGPGEPRWISCEASRHRVHRLRARVDAVMTGAGTVIADDPLLTARGTRLRRCALRVIIDPRLRTPLESQLMGSAAESPVLVCTSRAALLDRAEVAAHLRSCGVEVVSFAGASDRPDLASILRYLRRERNVSTVMVEAGPGLLGALFRADLIDEAVVFAAPGTARRAVPVSRPPIPDVLGSALTAGLVLIGEHRSGVDSLRCYRRPVP